MSKLRELPGRIWTSVRNFFVNDWFWKLISLGFALLIFFGVRGTISHTQTLTLTVEAEVPNGGQALTGIEPGVVAVTFRGSESAIRNLSLPGAVPPRVRLRLQQPPNDVSQMPLKIARRDISCPDGLRIVKIEPATVEASFDMSDTRTLSVGAPEVTGTPEDSTVTVSIEPTSVDVTGSRIRLDELFADGIHLTTAALDIGNHTEDFQTVLRVQPPDSNGGWTLRPDTVRADVHIVREDTKRVFSKVPVRVLQAPSGVRYRPETASVDITVFGPPRELDTIAPKDVMALVGEPEGVTAAERLRSTPTVVLPCTNRVTRVEVAPAKIYLTPEPEKEPAEKREPAKESPKDGMTVAKEPAK